MQRSSMQWVVIGILAALFGPGLWFFFNWTGGYGYGVGRGFMPHGTMMGGGMGLVMIIFWVIVLVALASLVAGLFSDRRGAGDEPNALAVLKRRYARGEIDKSEYEAKRRDLQA